MVEIDAWLDRFAAYPREAGLEQIPEIFDVDHPHRLHQRRGASRKHGAWPGFFVWRSA
jgi:hypothetical protein